MLSLEMATTKTRTLSTRVSHELAETVEADVTSTGTNVANLLRDLLDTRYAVLAKARKSNGFARKTDTDDSLLIEED